MLTFLKFWKVNSINERELSNWQYLSAQFNEPLIGIMVDIQYYVPIGFQILPCFNFIRIWSTYLRFKYRGQLLNWQWNVEILFAKAAESEYCRRNRMNKLRKCYGNALNLIHSLVDTAFCNALVEDLL